MNKTIQLVFLIILFACQQRHESKDVENISDRIVLFNIENANREQIAKALDVIGHCQPKVIGINAIFEREEYPRIDSVLANSIRIATRVILVSNLKNNELIGSDSMFLKYSLGQGVLSYGRIGNKVSKYKTFQSWRDQTLWTFPTAVVANFDMEMAKNVMNLTKGDLFYEIQYHSNTVRVFSIDRNSLDKLDCSLLNGKIILMGDLGPSDSDMYAVQTAEGKEYSTIILANIVTSMLRNSYSESDDQE